MVMTATEVPDPCPICGRPNFYPSDHHMIPKSQGGRTTKTICRDCHKACHSLFTNKQLAAQYHTAEALLAHEGFAKMVSFLRHQDPRRKQTFKKSNDTRRRGRSG